MKLTRLFSEFFESEKSAGLILMVCAAVSMVLANSSFSPSYLAFWHHEIFFRPIEFWINDGLMTVFFLLVGLEIEREIYAGELSSLKKSMLPVIAALGGMVVPAIIHAGFNYGTVFQNGFGIPMATDIAFSLAILSLLGKRVPVSLKIFLTALAIIDDLGAIVIIALFYSKNISLIFLGLAALLFVVLLVLNRMRFHRIWIYLCLGCLIWFFLFRAGIHPTISGVLLAFAMPFGKGDENSPSYKLQHSLHKPVAFFILPVFALANTAILIPDSVTGDLMSSNSLGIIFGLLIGKPAGIFLFLMAGAALGWCSFPDDVKRKHVFGTALLAGIGFTMSIFVSLLAFTDEQIVTGSKIAVLVASLLAGISGYLYLRMTLPKNKETELR